jgi:hypothetical protein
MATPKIQFDRFATDRLRAKLSDKIGYHLTNKPDCAKLSDLLVENGFSYLSESTLYRFFFLPDRHTPYKNTLDVLCRFVGYRDSPDFLDRLVPERTMLHENGINTLGPTSNSLLFYSIEHQSESPLLDFFSQMDGSPVAFRESICLSLFDSLLKNTQTDWFFRSFAHHHYIREYFLEKGHDPKFRIKNYEQAYLLYLDRINKKNDIKQFQDFVFGNCVLFRYYFFEGKKEKALGTGAKLYQNILSIEPYQHDLFVFPFIRFAAYKLWYLQLKGAKANELADYAHYLLDLGARLRAVFSHHEQKILLHTLAETFLHSHLPESFHDELKRIFAAEYRLLPEAVFSKHLKYSLPYFNMDGLLYHRP